MNLKRQDRSRSLTDKHIIIMCVTHNPPANAEEEEEDGDKEEEEEDEEEEEGEEREREE